MDTFGHLSTRLAVRKIEVSRKVSRNPARFRAHPCARGEHAVYGCWHNLVQSVQKCPEMRIEPGNSAQCYGGGRKSVQKCPNCPIQCPETWVEAGNSARCYGAVQKCPNQCPAGVVTPAEPRVDMAPDVYVNRQSRRGTHVPELYAPRIADPPDTRGRTRGRCAHADALHRSRSAENRTYNPTPTIEFREADSLPLNAGVLIFRHTRSRTERNGCDRLARCRGRPWCALTMLPYAFYYQRKERSRQCL